MKGVAAIVLAAGAAQRFGADKLAAPIAGRPVLAWTLRGLQDAGVATAFVVVDDLEGERARIARAEGYEPLVNPHPERGMGASIAAGARAAADADAVLILPGDMPLAPAIAPALVQAWRANVAAAVAPVHAGKRGHPVLFDKRAFAALQGLDADAGARGVLERFRDDLVLIDSPDDGVLLDIDTPDDAQAIAARLAPRSQ